MLPARTCPKHVGLTNIKSMCPAIISCMLPGNFPIGYELEAGAGLLLEEDAGHMRRTAGPMCPSEALSGFAMSHAVNSFRSFAGMAFFAKNDLRGVRDSAMGSKSLITSYGSA